MKNGNLSSLDSDDKGCFSGSVSLALCLRSIEAPPYSSIDKSLIDALSVGTFNRALMTTSDLGVIILFDLNSLIPSIDQREEENALSEILRNFIKIIDAYFSVLIVTSSTSIGLSEIKVAGMMDVILIVAEGS